MKIELELIKQFEESFKDMRDDLGFKPTLQELDSVFFLRDFIQKEGYVSKQLSRMVCSRMVDLYNNWASYLHGLVMPNPHSMFIVAESEMFDDDKKKEILLLTKRMMLLVSTNTLNGLTRNKENEAKFIEDAYNLWVDEVKPQLVGMLRTVNKGWKKKAEEDS